LKIRATIYKELLLLIRDPGGMALIFLMPAALVMVMALIQDAPFRDYQESGIEVLFVDLDNDSVGLNIQQSLQASLNFTLVNEKDAGVARSRVQSGDYKAAIIIPAGASASLRKNDDQGINAMFSTMGITTAQADTNYNPVEIQLLFDPAIKVNYRQALSGIVQKVIATVQTDLILHQLQKQLSAPASSNKTPAPDFTKMIRVKEELASEKKTGTIALNSVQHNVPAWTMFAMFFILFPLAGNFIKEREEGSMLRLRLISGSQFPAVVGKFAFYFLVCLLQFVLMLLIGIFVMPLLGLQPLVLGKNIAGIVVTASAVAMAATGYGLLIAVWFKTPQQALSFGSISVVILAAIGGVWVPVYVMPPLLQQLSALSPLNWGLESFNNLFLRNASMLAILPELLKLVCFAAATLVASFLIYRSRTIS
jgi:ABC-2 type transport system permease protein